MPACVGGLLPMNVDAEASRRHQLALFITFCFIPFHLCWMASQLLGYAYGGAQVPMFIQ